MFYTIENGNNTTTNINYYYSYNFITYVKKENGIETEKYHYNIKDDSIICQNGSCDNYLEIYNDAKDKFDEAFS